MTRLQRVLQRDAMTDCKPKISCLQLRPYVKYPKGGVHRIPQKWGTTCILRVRRGTLRARWLLPSRQSGLAGNRRQAVRGRGTDRRPCAVKLSSAASQLMAGALTGTGLELV